MGKLRALMIGDVVGEPGLEALERLLPGLIQDEAAAFVVVNGENAAAGFGMTAEVLARILAAGADVVTSGNHVWEKREFWEVLDSDEKVLRPANYPADTPGVGWIRLEKGGQSWVVINLQGREYLPPIDCPFRCFDAIQQSLAGPATDRHPLLEAGGEVFLPHISPIILVDFHAESTREKESLGYYLDGRATAAAGTHTHVQTADERILPQGTAYISDLGMTGAVDSIIGMDTKICLDRARYQVFYRMECANPGPHGLALRGAALEIDGETGRALSIRRINKVWGQAKG
jgi:metallophosphoesterase (TIGR00282 family)